MHVQRTLPFVVPFLVGALAVVVVGAGVNDWVDERTLSVMAPWTQDERVVLHAVAAPISEEVTKAVLVAAAAVAWFGLSSRRPLRFAERPWRIGGGAGQSLAMGAGFALFETFHNDDFSGLKGLVGLVAVRTVGHATFAFLLLGGLWLSIRRRHLWPGLAGLASAMAAHAAFNYYAVTGAGPLRTAAFAVTLLAACAVAWRFRDLRLIPGPVVSPSPAAVDLDP